MAAKCNPVALQRTDETEHLSLASGMTLTATQLALSEENRQTALHTRASHGLTAAQLARIEENRQVALRRRANRDHYFGEGCGHTVLPQLPCGLRVPLCPHDCTPVVAFKLEPPLNFGVGFALPRHRRRLLQVVHSHPRDARVQFDEGPHVYKIDGVPTLGSVTGLIRAFAEAFDSDSVIGKMVAGGNWPRPGYMKPVVPEWALEELRVHPAGAALLQALLEQPADEQAIAAVARDLRYKSLGLKTVIESIALSPEEIKDQWQANGREAANRGTWMHYTFELHLNRELLEDDSREFQLFRQFLSTLTGYTAYRTEWWIFADRERLAGSIDFAAMDAFGALILVDWKRSKNISNKYSNKFRRMQPPLEHLEDVSGLHYRLQLNCYKFIIQQYYGMVVSKMLVVCTHPDNGPNAFVDHVPSMLREIELLMDWQRNRALDAV